MSKIRIELEILPAEIQDRMTRSASHIRSAHELKAAVKDTGKQLADLEKSGCLASTLREFVHALNNRQLCLSPLVYLEAILFLLESGVGSRGSGMVQGSGGVRIHPRLDAKDWSFIPEDTLFRDKVLETVYMDGIVQNRWVDRRPIPESKLWFETAWADFRDGRIYDQ
jgi:hypothetical protein